MNYKLLAFFIAVQFIEFALFWGIASCFGGNTLNIFLFIVGFDIIATVIFYNSRIQDFIDVLLNKDS